MSEHALIRQPLHACILSDKNPLQSALAHRLRESAVPLAIRTFFFTTFPSMLIAVFVLDMPLCGEMIRYFALINAAIMGFFTGKEALTHLNQDRNFRRTLRHMKKISPMLGAIGLTIAALLGTAWWLVMDSFTEGLGVFLLQGLSSITALFTLEARAAYFKIGRRHQELAEHDEKRYQPCLNGQP